MTKIKTIWQKFKRWIVVAVFGGTALAAGLSGIPQDLYNNLNVKVYTACDPQEAKIISIADSFTTFKARNPDNSLRELNAKERAGVKTCEMAKRGTEFAGIYDSPQYGVKIEIIGEVKNIEINGQHGVELFARAWRGTQQLGFGSDGSVEIERFRIFNPPILVDDPNGTIIRESINPDTQLIVQRKLREDPIEATRQVISHNAKIVGKDNGKIVIGKVGNTTSTFYPDAGSGGTTVDGRLSKYGVTTWSAARDAANSTEVNKTETVQFIAHTLRAAADDWSVYRTIFTFDTSSIGSADIISSATFSFYEDSSFTFQNDDADTFDLVAASPNSNNDLIVQDYSTLGTVVFASVALSSVNVDIYNNLSLNASGIADINKTGITRFGGRNETDRSNTAPGGRNQIPIRFVDYADTTSDPKLVVEHTSPAVQGEEYTIIFE